jgi:hypothetical protein
MSEFGCEGCCPVDADAAWQARSTLVVAFDLIDESHFHVMILKCPHCSQHFLSVFTETIDWQGGDDSQYSTLLPLLAAEVATLTQDGQILLESTFTALGIDRKHLKHDHPKGMRATSYWVEAPSVGPPLP